MTRYLTIMATWPIIALLATAGMGGLHAAAAETLLLTCKATGTAGDEKGQLTEFDVTRHFEIEDRRVLVDGGEWTRDVTTGQQFITFTATVVPGAALHQATINRITGAYEEHVIELPYRKIRNRLTGTCVKEELKKQAF